jgi:transposase
VDGADTRVDEPIEYAPFSGALGGFWRWRRSMTVRRTEAAKIGGVGLQIIPDWMLRFNARGPDALVNGKSPGQPSKLNDAQRQAIAEMIERGPIPAIHGVARWRLIDLAQWIFEEFRIKSPNRR